jgi:hypothetical protein
MAKGKNLREAQEEYADKVVGLCCVCEKPVPGFYGMWQEGGTCSKKCEQEREKQPKHVGHSEEDFLSTFKDEDI